ncbi:hypothetical protein GCM10011313_28100 [Mycetocola zhadangensis]|nr:hypothetical protein GCM10011313_28100 [Mycetocola zhadangensis]
MQPSCGRIECSLELVTSFCRRIKRRQQLSDNGTAEARSEQFLDLDHDAKVLRRVGPLATSRSLWCKKSLLLVVAKRPNANPAPCRKLTDSHMTILTYVAPEADRWARRSLRCWHG